MEFIRISSIDIGSQVSQPEENLYRNVMSKLEAKLQSDFLLIIHFSWNDKSMVLL